MGIGGHQPGGSLLEKAPRRATGRLSEYSLQAPGVDLYLYSPLDQVPDNRGVLHEVAVAFRMGEDGGGQRHIHQG